MNAFLGPFVCACCGKPKEFGEDCECWATPEPQPPVLVALASLPETFYKKLEDLFPVERMTDDQVRTMNHALGHPKDADYRPYCMKMGCNVMPRMFRVAEGFRCWACGNIIGFDLQRIDTATPNPPSATAGE